MCNGPMEPTQPKPTKSVGMEFVEWAERGWGLKSMYDKAAEQSKGENAESCPYEVMKNMFILKIDEIIQDRLTK